MVYRNRQIVKAQDVKEATEYYQKLAEKYNANGYLTNKEFAQLLELLRSIGYQEGVDALASSDVRSPKGWIRPSCSICRKPLLGLVTNPSIGSSKKALESVSEFQHHKCKKSKEPATTT